MGLGFRSLEFRVRSLGLGVDEGLWASQDLRGQGDFVRGLVTEITGSLSSVYG